MTSQLQDILVDLYPTLYDKCDVAITCSWSDCVDPIKACSTFKVKYIVDWPVSMIITKEHLEMYDELFNLVLKVKWALHTLNRLNFEGKSACRVFRQRVLAFSALQLETFNKQVKVAHIYVKKLRILRFYLVNAFSSIQHYICGHIFNKYLRRFNADFEHACNLDMLIECHHEYISSMSRMVKCFRECDGRFGFEMVSEITVRSISILALMCVFC